MADLDYASQESPLPPAKPSRTYWVVSLTLMLWSLAYAGLVISVFVDDTDRTLDALDLSGTILPGYSDFAQDLPTWIIALTVAKTVTRLGGALALLLRRSQALMLFALSFCIVCVIFMRGFLFADGETVIRPLQVFIEVLFFSLSVFAVWFAGRSALQGLFR